jgi:hypothetical protein
MEKEVREELAKEYFTEAVIAEMDDRVQKRKQEKHPNIEDFVENPCDDRTEPIKQTEKDSILAEQVNLRAIAIEHIMQNYTAKNETTISDFNHLAGRLISDASLFGKCETRPEIIDEIEDPEKIKEAKDDSFDMIKEEGPGKINEAGLDLVALQEQRETLINELEGTEDEDEHMNLKNQINDIDSQISKLSRELDIATELTDYAVEKVEISEE